MPLRPEYKEIIERASKANQERIFFAQYPEHPKSYGEEAPLKGKADFEAQLGKQFCGLLQTNPVAWSGEEVSPYTMQEIGLTYPTFDIDTLIVRASRAFGAWKETLVDDRADILVDALERVKNRFFEIAHATQHTTGQSFMMSFQASGPHANDRALEALAMGYQEATRFPNEVVWEKPAGKSVLKLNKKFKPVAKGVSLVIGCSTFPTWNSVPGIFASLITGNTVIVKPHPKSIYPMAVVVAEIQAALKEGGFDTNICQLAVDTLSKPLTKELAENPIVKLIDYTGGSAFGNYIESLSGKTTFTEKAGVNSVILDSVSDLAPVLQNIAFSLSLYTGQMCTAPQNIFIPSSGIKVGDQQMSYEDIVKSLCEAIFGIAKHPQMGPGTFGAVQNELTIKRVKSVSDIAKSLLSPSTIENPEFPSARTSSHIVLEVESKDSAIFESELFGPIVIIVKTESTHQSVSLARDLAAKHGAITCLAYTIDEVLASEIELEMESSFTPVTFNFVGGIFVNQHSAFSDFHVTGGNPAGNASFSNPEYVNKRFVWVGHRRMAQ
jgi:phenylacetic acid degradation protein paaN